MLVTANHDLAGLIAQITIIIIITIKKIFRIFCN